MGVIGIGKAMGGFAVRCGLTRGAVWRKARMARGVLPTGGVWLCLWLLVAPAAAQQVYRCETGGKVAYSDAPCVGAKIIDATPTQGMDKMAGSSRKGREVQRDEFNREFDKALRPLHGRSHEEMNALRKRVHLPAQDQQRCAQLDGSLPSLEADARDAKAEAKARADVALYKARKLFFDLKC